MTLFNLFIKKMKYEPLAPAISWNDGQRIISLNNIELWIEFKKVISFLKNKKVKAGDRVGILSHSSGYWHLADLAIMALGGTTIPIYPTASDDEIDFIVRDSNMSMLIIDNKPFINSESKAIEKIDLVYFNESIESNYFLSYKDLPTPPDQDIIELIKENVGNSPASIIYTSGTTATPKGVITVHEAIKCVLDGIASQMKGKVSRGNKSLTCLPLSHVLGRCDSLLHFCLPIQTYIAKSPKTFMNDLKAAKQNYIITVPRVIEKIRERVEISMKKKGVFSKKLFSINYSIANSYFEKIDAGISPTQLETQLFIKSQKYFFSKIRAQISSELKFLVSGGAKLGAETYCFFRNIGIPILEGYGLTESFGPAFLNSHFNGPPGNVGFPLPGVKLKFAADAEILLKSDSIFKNYNQIDSASYFDADGYFKTGDIGEWSISEGLKITDRKKDIIVTSGGKNIAPAKIEALMNGCPHISHFMLVGDQRNYLTGLVSINKENFNEFMETGLISPGIEHGELSQHAEIIKLIDSEIFKVNEGLASYERVKRVFIIPVSITPNSIYLSASLKLKKDKLFNKYKKEIDAMY